MVTKEERKKYNQAYYKKNRDAILKQKLEYSEVHRHEKRKYDKIYREKNKNIIKKKIEDHLLRLKQEAFNILGGASCAICGDNIFSHLTIDHVNNDGSDDRKSGLTTHTLHCAIVRGKLTENKLKNLRILCWNHNCSRTREYLDLQFKDQNTRQRQYTKLWKEAFDFFGPCEVCGEKNLKFLTIAHINDDGAERRRRGEGLSTALIQKFRNAKWPKDLKEIYCIQCFTCNCSDYYGNKIKKINKLSQSSKIF